MDGQILERGPLVPYKDRKRKRTISAQTDSDSDSSSESKHTISAQPNLGKSDIKPSKKAKVSPKSASHITEKRREKGNAKHSRRASSVTSLKQLAKMETESPLRKKPESKDKSGNGNDDDNLSVANSAVNAGRLRRNEAERIQYFENESECGKMEPHQVHCLRCNKPVNLGRKQTYAVRPWEIHRARCDQRPALVVFTGTDTKMESESTSEPTVPSGPRPASQPTPARRPSEQERKGFLESDSQIEKVEKHSVLCRKCQIWVDLGQNSSYATSHWVKHKLRCSTPVPSSRVTAAKRSLVLVNDAQAKSFDPKSVECALCCTEIKLEGEGDFNLVKWNEHKLSCIKSVKSAPILKNDRVNSVPFPGQPCRPPLSSASTEDTLIVDASRPEKGLKRTREDPDHLPHEEMPKLIRQRTDLYLPPTMEPPNSILGWFMMPVHSFVRGFKESLRDRC